MPRDTTKDAAYYDRAIGAREHDLATALDELGRGDIRPNPGFYCVRVGKLDELLWLRYSRGDDLGGVREALLQIPPALATWLELEAAARAEAAAAGMSKELLNASFMRSVYFDKIGKAGPAKASHRHALRWLSLAFLLDLPADVARAFAAAITRSGVERLCDHLAAATVPGWSVAGKIAAPELYGPLTAALEGGEPESARTAQLGAFVDSWRARVRGPEHGPHMLRDLNYVGTWCVEAAAVAVLSGTTDAAFREHRHYPRDLADARR
jgi:hypothetical protein